jgi:signal transduction histidine kinase
MTVTTALAIQSWRDRIDEQLADHVAQLARRNQALEDFAALVAHDIRTSLLAALRCDTPHDGLTRSLDLVDSILDAVRAERSHGDTPSVASCARRAAEDLSLTATNIVIVEDGPFPMPPTALRLVLRNTFANAAAAGATYVRVSVSADRDCHTLVVDDDGCGPGATESYDVGAGLGLSLCRRLLGRFEAALSLSSRPAGGTRATLAAQRRESDDSTIAGGRS